MKAVFECERLVAGYRRVPVIRDLSVAVKEGEFLALLGPNGAGKSTLLRVLTGLLSPISGSAKAFGRPVSRMKPSERARLMAVVPQELSTPMAYTVEDLAAMGRSSALRPWEGLGENDRHIVERAMIYADVIELRGSCIEALSGGEKQRAIIAMALAQEPRVLLMDEPTTHLDMNHALEIMQIVERLNREQGVTVLMTSHDLNLVSEFCGRLLLMDGGRMIADGPPADVLREDVLQSVYHCDIRVQRNIHTHATLVVPTRRFDCLSSGALVRVHVIAGGGSGGELLRRLCIDGYGATCGVLNRRDTDALAAEALGVKAALEEPFSPVGPAALSQAQAFAREADALVICEVPFGPGNLANLDIADEALRRGIKVFVNASRLEQRDFCGHRAAIGRIQRLLDGGAVQWRQLDDLMRELSGLGSLPRGAPEGGSCVGRANLT